MHIGHTRRNLISLLSKINEFKKDMEDLKALPNNKFPEVYKDKAIFLSGYVSAFDETLASAISLINELEILKREK